MSSLPFFEKVIFDIILLNNNSTIHSSKVPNGTFVYMTFDDGPNEGTPYVLDALK